MGTSLIEVLVVIVVFLIGILAVTVASFFFAGNTFHGVVSMPPSLAPSLLQLDIMPQVRFWRARLGLDLPFYPLAVIEGSERVGWGDVRVDGRVVVLDAADAPVGVALGGGVRLSLMPGDTLKIRLVNNLPKVSNTLDRVVDDPLQLDREVDRNDLTRVERFVTQHLTNLTTTLVDFTKRAADYETLQRKLDATLGEVPKDGRPEQFMDHQRALARLQIGEKIQALGGAKQLDGDDVFGVGHDGRRNNPRRGVGFNETRQRLLIAFVGGTFEQFFD